MSKDLAMHKRATIGVVVSLLVVGMSGCEKLGENKASPGEAATVSPASLESMLRRIPEGERAAVKARLDSLQVDLGRSLDEAAKLAGPARDDALAQLAGATLNQIRLNSVEVARLDEQLAGGAVSKENHKARATELALRTEVLKSFAVKARASSPMVDAAVARWEASLASNPDKPLSFGDVLTQFKREPCLYMPARGAKATSFAAAGAELGMTRDEALSALCQSQKGRLTLKSEEPDAAYADLDRLDFGVHLDAMERFRKGEGVYDQIRADDISVLNSRDGRDVRQKISRPYLGKTKICLDCVDDLEFDSVLLNYLPDGRVLSIVRDRTFAAPYARNGQIVRNSPRRFADVSAELAGQYGKPSFVSRNPNAIILGWSFPDRKTLAPQEYWKQYMRLERPGWGGFSVNEIDLNGASVATGEHVPSAAILAKRSPKTTYCLINSRLLRNNDFPGMAFGAFHYGSPAARYRGEMEIMVGGKRVFAMPYDRSLEGAGQTSRCGIGILAVITSPTIKNVDGALDIPPETSVSRVTLTLLDVDQSEHRAMSEVRDVLARVERAESN